MTWLFARLRFHKVRLQIRGLAAPLRLYSWFRHLTEIRRTGLGCCYTETKACFLKNSEALVYSPSDTCVRRSLCRVGTPARFAKGLPISFTMSMKHLRYWYDWVFRSNTYFFCP